MSWGQIVFIWWLVGLAVLITLFGKIDEIEAQNAEQDRELEKGRIVRERLYAMDPVIWFSMIVAAFVSPLMLIPFSSKLWKKIFP